MFQHDLTEATAQTRSANRPPRVAISRKGNGSLPESILRLQRDLGNHRVGTLLEQTVSRAESADTQPSGDMEVIERSIQNARGGGQQLDTSTRNRMESAFDADFGAVRVHTDSHADELSRALNARAFTTGSDVFFKHGEFHPGSSGGRELLAHELTHVVQQSDAVQRRMSVSQPDDPHELEAERMARAVVESETHSEPAALQRQPEAAGLEDEEKKLHRQVDKAERGCSCSGG